jgi:glycerol kinase
MDAQFEGADPKLLKLIESLQKNQIQLESRLEELERKKLSESVSDNADDDVSELIGAIDQGTTSSRFLIFNRAGEPIASHQIEFKQIYPNSGYVPEPS